MVGESMNVRVLQVHGFVVAALVSVVAAWCFAWDGRPLESSPPTSLEEKINPNFAPAASLVRLPQIGLARARAIVVYRDTIRAGTGDRIVFRCPEDLQRIGGVGPRTVAGIADWLEFDVPQGTGSRETGAISNRAQ